MPVYVEGRAQRVQKTKEYMELLKYVDLHPIGNFTPNTWAVKNPHPEKFQITWADPKKVEEHKWFGAVVVDPKRGMEVYGIKADEINKTRQSVERRGMVMMEYPRELFEAKIARMTLKSLALMDKDIQKFYNARDGRACDPVVVGSDGRKLRGEESVQRRRRVTPQTAGEENEKRRSAKMTEFNLAYKQFIKEQIEKGDLTLDQVRRMEGIDKKQGIDYIGIPDLSDGEDAIDNGATLEELISSAKGDPEE